MALEHLYDPKWATWRAQYNPLRALTMTRVVHALAQQEMGYRAEAQWLYLFIERRDAVLRAVMQRRLASIKKLDWSIKIKEGMEENGLAKQQQKFLKGVYEGIDNLKQSFEFMATATFRGYAHLEKHYDEEDGDLSHLEPVPQYLWANKLPSKDWLFNAKAFQTATGVPIDPENFIIRECAAPVNEVAVIAFMRKSMSLKDWDGWIEAYGIPPLFITLPPGVGTASNEPGNVVDTYQQLAQEIISNGRGVLPNGAEIINPTKEVAGTVGPFSEHVREQNEQIVLAATSGLLTSLSAPTGMNDSQAGAHENTFMDLAKSEALEISETFQRAIDDDVLEEEFPNQDALAYFELAHHEVEDADVVGDVQILSQAGYQMDPEELSEKTGYKLTLKPQMGAGAPGGMPGAGRPSWGGNGGGNGTGNGEGDQGGEGDRYPGPTDFMRQDVANRVRPVTDAIRNALSAKDEELIHRLEEIERLVTKD